MHPSLRAMRAMLPALGIVALLCGCAGDGNTPTSNGRMFGLISGPIPPAQPFVVQSRHPVPATYPAVGITPPARTDTILPVPDRAKLETDLKRYAKTPQKTVPPSAGAAAQGTAAAKRKKVVPQT